MRRLFDLLWPHRRGVFIAVMAFAVGGFVGLAVGCPV